MHIFNENSRKANYIICWIAYTVKLPMNKIRSKAQRFDKNAKFEVLKHNVEARSNRESKNELKNTKSRILKELGVVLEIIIHLLNSN